MFPNSQGEVATEICVICAHGVEGKQGKYRIVKLHMSFMSGMARDGLYFKAMPSICVFMGEIHLSAAVWYRDCKRRYRRRRWDVRL